MDSLPTTTSKDAIYLFGFSPKHHERALSDEIDCQVDLPVQNGVYGSVRYWFYMVDRNEFEGEQGEENLKSITWLAPRAMLHESILKSLAADRPFYPASFGTLFSSLQMLEQRISLALPALSDYFEQTQACHEWGVRCELNRAHAQHLMEKHNASQATGSVNTGLHYLLQKKEKKDLAQKLDAWTEQQLKVFFEEVKHAFGDYVPRKVVGGSHNQKDIQLVANIALLVRLSEEATLDAFVKHWNANRFESTALSLQLTGPWPCFSFRPSLAG